MQTQSGFYAGKSVLITQNSLVHLAGSEVQAIELALYLQSKGAAVTLYTWICEDPLKSSPSLRNLSVVSADDEEAAALSFSDFDIVWVQHEALPLSMLSELGELSPEELQAKFIFFSHMSPFSELHVEYPYQRDLEDLLASCIVFNSEETAKAQSRLFKNHTKFELYPNPAPETFVELDTSSVSALRKILVVSNHPPREITQAIDILHSENIEVDLLGDENDKKPRTQFDSEILGQYDAVISIGKTVQDCLVAGVPVYVYDYFGGPGYLTEGNFEQAAFYNFSGRSTNESNSIVVERSKERVERRDASQIAEEIRHGFRDTLKFQRSIRQTCIEKYSLHAVLARLMRKASNKQLRIEDEITEKDVQWFLHIQRMMMDYHVPVVWKLQGEQLFYSQKISVFRSQNGEYSAQGSETLDVQLQQHTSLTIEEEGFRYLRIDYGETPAVVTNFIVRGIDRSAYSITTNALIESDNGLIFPGSDPQIIVKFDDNALSDSDSLTIECDIIPFAGFPEAELNTIGQFQKNELHELMRIRKELHSIKESRWWLLGEKLRRILRRG